MIGHLAENMQARTTSKARNQPAKTMGREQSRDYVPPGSGDGSGDGSGSGLGAFGSARSRYGGRGRPGAVFRRKESKMGYTTSFSGKFSITPPLDDMARIAYREAFGDESSDGPGGYNQWEVSADGSTLAWDGGEKFYDYVEWARYVSGWLKSRGSTLCGSVRWKGEDFDDIGVITVTDGVVTTSEDDGPTVAIAVPERWIAAVIDREMEPEDLGRRIVGLSKGKTYPTGGRS